MTQCAELDWATRHVSRVAGRRAVAEATHRTGLLCWLSHGRLLSEQADDSRLQARLLSLLPSELLGKSTSAVSGVDVQAQVEAFEITFQRMDADGSNAALESANTVSLNFFPQSRRSA